MIESRIPYGYKPPGLPKPLKKPSKKTSNPLHSTPIPIPLRCFLLRRRACSSAPGYTRRSGARRACGRYPPPSSLAAKPQVVVDMPGEPRWWVEAAKNQ